MEITKEFIVAVEQGAEALRDLSAEVKKSPEFSQPGTISRLLAGAVETKYQTADLLDGWAVRARKEFGLEPRA